MDIKLKVLILKHNCYFNVNKKYSSTRWTILYTFCNNYLFSLHIHFIFPPSFKNPEGFDTCIISSASRGIAGEFTVKATNDMGTAECKAMLKVNSEYKGDTTGWSIW